MSENRYLIASDLDGTLLTSEGRISEKTKEYISELRGRGHLFVIATGRVHQRTYPFHRELALSCPMICNNGSSVIEYNDDYTAIKTAVVFPMDTEAVRRFNEEVKSFLYTGMVTTLTDFFTYDLERCPPFFEHNEKYGTYHIGDVPALLFGEPVMSEYYVYDEYKEDFDKILLKQEYTDVFDFIHWGKWEGIHSYEVVRKGVSKGAALRHLAEKYGIPRDRIIAFGDQLNDIPMIEYALTGVAMANAMDEAKKSADFITELTNNGDGVISFLAEHLK